MGKTYEALDEKLIDWIGRQSMFFVGTAPTAADGHVNVSPKGPIESLGIVDAHTVAYLDFVGSGAETVAHLRENGRVVVMLCAFDGPPRVLRLHGRGTVVRPDAALYAELSKRLGFARLAGARDGSRAIVLIELERIADSCGYGVPLLERVGERPQRQAWLESKLRNGGANAVRDYVETRNARSVDGLPSFGT